MCWGTSFQQVLYIGKHRDAQSVWQVFSRGWTRIFGMPECIAVDPGTEFQGYFGQMTSSHDTALFPTDARAPWQNGRTERSGKEWKRQFKLASRRETPTTMAEWIALGELCCSVRNRYQNRSGYSPLQRVFGFSPRLPASLLSDDAIDPAYLTDDPLDDFKRSEELRVAATRAWARLDSRDRLRRALTSRHRIPEEVFEGQLLFVWRQPRVGAGHWVGPGVVPIAAVGGAWVNMRGNLWRVSKEQLRPATDEESRGCEMVNRFLHNMREVLRGQRGARRYVDVTTEGAPYFAPPAAGAEDAPAGQADEDAASALDEPSDGEDGDEPEREASAPSAVPSEAQV